MDSYYAIRDRLESSIADNHDIRTNAYDMLTQTHTMVKFLVEMTPEAVAKAKEPVKQLTEEDCADEDVRKRRQDDLEEQSIQESAERLRSIKTWQDVADNFTMEDKVEALNEHRQKLARVRNRKEWQALIEEDDDDKAADKLISDIKNYNREFFWKSAFYK